MTILPQTVAKTYSYIIGVDTHARKHVYSIITYTGEHVETRDFPATSSSIKRAIAWVGRRTGADASTLWIIEGTASYGAVVTGAVTDAGYTVAEAPSGYQKAGRGVGKTDPLDAQRMAAAALPIEVQKLRVPRLNDGARAALRVLVTARDMLAVERTKYVNALTALLRVTSLGIDARKPLSSTQILEVAGWRSREETIESQVARAEAVRLARRVGELDTHIKENTTQMTELVKLSEGKELLELTGIGPVVAAVCVAAWSHQGRLRSEAAFASLAGVNPIPASSGNTVRHRLNRRGDRKLNKALHTAAMVRMTHDEETRAYVAKRTAEGKTLKEIRRCIKRFLARRIYKILESAEVLPLKA